MAFLTLFPFIPFFFCLSAFTVPPGGYRWRCYTAMPCWPVLGEVRQPGGYDNTAQRLAKRPAAAEPHARLWLERPHSAAGAKDEHPPQI